MALAFKTSRVIAASQPANSESVVLTPSYHIPLGFVVLAIPLLWVQAWVSLALTIFGLFLLWQAVSLRLCFSSTDLDIYRGETRIRRFPYTDWQNWRLWWPGFPILLYFREVQSIHFLPILFSPTQLRECLERHCPHVN
jgi:hypothetical protein